MECCIEARALKPSLRHEIDGRSCSKQATAVTNLVSVADEVVYESEFNGGGFVDDFLIDDLLDFPEKEPKEEEEKESLSDCSVELEIDENGNSTVSGSCLDLEIDDAGLAVPQDDLADLEWVSRFVDDSMPEYPSGKEYAGVNYRETIRNGSFPVQLKQPYNNNNEIKPVIPAKPRTKRQRVGRVWSIGSSNGSESSTTTSSSLSSSSIISTPVQFGFSKPGLKRQKTERKPKQVQLLGGGNASIRKCSHCQVQKTPQWRAGPEGAKTLCNACGVRFKSGRLYPEYRPACSPTFREEVHSNSHRKVLEMRKEKDVVDLSSPIQFGLILFNSTWLV